MKQYSQDFINVLRRARYDSQFAQEVIKAPQRALNYYELNKEEQIYLTTFKSEQDLQDEFNRYEKTRHGINRASNLKLITIYTISFSLYLLLLIGYYLISTYRPEFLKSLGLIPLNNLTPTAKIVLGLYVVICLVFLIFSLVIFIPRKFAQMGPSSRVTVLIGTVIFFLVPASYVLSALAPSTRSTIMRILLTLVFTILPASLYSLFITTRSKTLFDEFLLNISRLDPVSYKQSTPIYKKKFIVLYGPPDQSGFGSVLLQGEVSFPVLFATLVIGLGWIMLFFVGEPSILSKGGIVAEGFLGGYVSAFTYGFLGAYLFSLSMLFRRYVQSDLKSVAYTHISQRILLTWVWAFVLNVLPWEAINVDRIVFVSILAFFVGVFPDIAWQVVSRRFGNWLSLSWSKLGRKETQDEVKDIKLRDFRGKKTLDEIVGITFWMEARLLEEDIENIENLITTNIVDLMLRTNLKPERIIHWIDQGVLRMHLDYDDKTQLNKELHDRGIMTATDLLYTHRAAMMKSQVFLSDPFDPIIESLVVAIEDDPNMYHVLAWRQLNADRNERLPKAVKALIAKEAKPETLPPETLPISIPTPSESPAVAKVIAGNAAEAVVAVADSKSVGYQTEPDIQHTKGLEYIQGVGSVYCQKLGEAGIATVDVLLEKGSTPSGRKMLSETTGISDKLILRWVNMADLYRIKGIGQEYANLLEATGVDTIPELAQRVPANLLAKMETVNIQKKMIHRVPTLSQVENWIEQAKKLPRVITY